MVAEGADHGAKGSAAASYGADDTAQKAGIPGAEAALTGGGVDLEEGLLGATAEAMEGCVTGHGGESYPLATSPWDPGGRNPT